MDLLNIDGRLSAIEQALKQNKRVLNFKEACEFTGFGEAYMYKMTSAGIIPHSKPNGKTLFFDREKLEEWMLSNSRTSSSEKGVIAATYLATSKNKQL